MSRHSREATRPVGPRGTLNVARFDSGAVMRAFGRTLGHQNRGSEIAPNCADGEGERNEVRSRYEAGVLVAEVKRSERKHGARAVPLLGAYHQGTIWPWLLGPFVRAYLHVFGRSPERIAYCRALFRGLELHMNEACLGLVSEVFDADPPFSPGGAPAQAWSVAELLQVLTVDLEGEPVRSPARPPQVSAQVP
jgi:hypothetical protein